MTLIFQFSFFETCLKELVKKIYIFKPELMIPDHLSKKEYNYTETIEELIKNLNNEVDWWGYRNIDKIANRLKQRFNINLKQEFNNWEKLREAYTDYLREYATVLNFKERFLNLALAIREWDKKYNSL